MSAYFDALTEAMTTFAKHPKALVVGQQTLYDGQRMHASLAGVSMEKRIEMPVAENFQMGFCTGLSLEGYIPLCIFPRIDFLVIAMDQLCNHLDKIAEMSDFRPKVIIRTSIGAKRPLDPGPQHTQNHVQALRGMLRRIPIEHLTDESQIEGAYKWASAADHSSILVENMEFY